MSKSKKQLVLQIATRQVPLNVSIQYAGRSDRDTICMRVLEFRLGELSRPRKRLAAANLSRTVQLAGPWDVSGANPVQVESLRVVRGAINPFETGILLETAVVAVGNKRVREYFGPKRQDLFAECVKALNRLDLLPAQPKASV